MCIWLWRCGAALDLSQLTLFEGAPIAVFDGRPHGLADDDVEGAQGVPTAPKPGAVLGAVKDKPFGGAYARP
jgi:hypothetical protein